MPDPKLDRVVEGPKIEKTPPLQRMRTRPEAQQAGSQFREPVSNEGRLFLCHDTKAEN